MLTKRIAVLGGAQKSIIVDLRSDHFSHPTEEMKKAMITCPLGNDYYGEDPTVNLLEDKLCDYFGKEASVYLPSATMANIIAAMIHCDSGGGGEILCGHQSHLVKYDNRGIAAVAGVAISTLQDRSDGTFDPSEFETALEKSGYHQPNFAVVVIENTHNMCGGQVMPLEWINNVAYIAKKHSIAVHMDGARLFNALPLYDVHPKEVVRNCDSISLCFSKGLGAPGGAMLIGTKEFIDKARTHKKTLGGTLIQAGVLAGAAIYALDHIAPKLILDHEKAVRFAKALNGINHPHFSIDSDIHTNILLLNISPESKVKAEEFIKLLSAPTECCTDENGNAIKVLAFSRDKNTLRLVFHYDISEEMTDLAFKKVSHVIENIE